MLYDSRQGYHHGADFSWCMVDPTSEACTAKRPGLPLFEFAGAASRYAHVKCLD